MLHTFNARTSLVVPIAIGLASLGLIFDAGCSKKPQGSEPLSVFAAVSTSDAIDEIAPKFEERNGTKVVTNYLASSILAEQIINGAAADIFLSANEAWADKLDEEKLVAERMDLLGNQLVIVAPAAPREQKMGLADFTTNRVGRIALAAEGVPAGDYARQALKNAGLLEELQPKIVNGSDVRETLALVERGEADAGIVYVTDAAMSSKVNIVADIEASQHDPIRYPLVLLKSAAHKTAARRMYEYLQSPDAIAVFRRRGFMILDKKDAETATAP